MQTYIVRRPAVAAGAAALEAALDRLRALADFGTGLCAHWQQAYVLREGDTGFGLLCVVAADGLSAVHEHAALARLPAQEVLPVTALHAGRPFARTLVHLVRRRSCWGEPEGVEAALVQAREHAERRQPRETHWLCSHVVREADGRLGSFCLYQAIDAAALRAHAAEAGLPADEIVPVFGRIVLRDSAVPAG